MNEAIPVPEKLGGDFLVDLPTTARHRVSIGENVFTFPKSESITGLGSAVAADSTLDPSVRRLCQNATDELTSLVQEAERQFPRAAFEEDVKDDERFSDRIKNAHVFLLLAEKAWSKMTDEQVGAVLKRIGTSR